MTQTPPPSPSANELSLAAIAEPGLLLVNKSAGVSSFGLLEDLQRAWLKLYGGRRRALPKLGHGGTLDPFATGLLPVCVGAGAKLARYFLGADKVYGATVRFGQSTIPGDPTEPVTETSDVLPTDRASLQVAADAFAAIEYLQTPPMHSAKKIDGKVLYELARQGVEVEREAKSCRLHEFAVEGYTAPCAEIRVRCTSGTYIRTLAQDFGRKLGTVAMLDRLERIRIDHFDVRDAWTIDQITAALAQGKKLSDLPCWIAFDRMLDGFDYAPAEDDEAQSLIHGLQGVLPKILARVKPGTRGNHGDIVAIYQGERLLAVARSPEASMKGIREAAPSTPTDSGRGGGLPGAWLLERVFTPESRIDMRPPPRRP